jgi:hypothetical protein
MIYNKEIIQDRIKEYKNNLNRLESIKKPSKTVLIKIRQEQLKIKRLLNN